MSISVVGPGHPVPCRSLREYVSLLFVRLTEAEPAAAARIREVVGARRARITLDAESVDVFFARGRLRVVESSSEAVDGNGRISRQATLDLMDGYLEVTSAVLDGDLELDGSADAVTRMAAALEVLLDGATRAPALQRLAQDFRHDPCRPAPAVRAAGPFRRATRFYPDAPGDRERRILARWDLLP